MVLRQAEEAEKTAADIWERVGGDDEAIKEDFIEKTSPILLRWERNLVNPYIQRILELDAEINILKDSLKQKEAFLNDCLSKVAQRKGQA